MFANRAGHAYIVIKHHLHISSTFINSSCCFKWNITKMSKVSITGALSAKTISDQHFYSVAPYCLIPCGECHTNITVWKSSIFIVCQREQSVQMCTINVFPVWRILRQNILLCRPIYRNYGSVFKACDASQDTVAS